MREAVDVVYVPRIGGVVTGVQKWQAKPALVARWVMKS